MEGRNPSSTLKKNTTAIALWNGGQYLSQFKAQTGSMIEIWANKHFIDLTTELQQDEILDLIQYSKESELVEVNGLDSVFCFSYFFKNDLLLLYFVVSD